MTAILAHGHANSVARMQAERDEFGRGSQTKQEIKNKMNEAYIYRKVLEKKKEKQMRSNLRK